MFVIFKRKTIPYKIRSLDFGFLFFVISVAEPECLSPILIKEFKYFNPKNCYLSSRKYDSSCSTRIRILIFYPDPGVKKAPDPGSGSATLFVISICV